MVWGSSQLGTDWIVVRYHWWATIQLQRRRWKREEKKKKKKREKKELPNLFVVRCLLSLRIVIASSKPAPTSDDGSCINVDRLNGDVQFRDSVSTFTFFYYVTVWYFILSFVFRSNILLRPSVRVFYATVVRRSSEYPRCAFLTKRISNTTSSSLLESRAFLFLPLFQILS